MGYSNVIPARQLISQESTMRRYYTAIVVALYLLLLGGSLIAQGSSALPPQPTPLTPVATPLTATEKKDIEILTLKAQLAAAQKRISDLQVDVGVCQAVLGPAQFEQQRQGLTGEQQALKDAIEKARPGFLWDPATGTFTVKPAVEKPKS